MEFKTIKGVPIVSTGTYPLGSGETTFTPDDLASAVLAANDPTVSAPRIKIGHHDRRFESDPALDGEPAFGTVRNMALSDDGQTIIGDLADVPAWLADSMQSAYPGRSIEGGLGYTAPSGHNYKLAISNLALLGTTLPGVGSLPDLQEVLSKNGKVTENATIEASSQRFVMAAVGGTLDAEDEAEVAKLMREGKTRAQAVKIVEESADEKNEERDAKRKGVNAGLNLGSIPRTFAADLRAGRVPKSGDLDQSRWWPRGVEAADDGGLSILVDTAADKLLRLPITVADKTLNYGEPVPVTASAITLSVDGKVLAEAVKASRVLASYPYQPTRQETTTMKLNGIDVDQAVVAKSLGLADDADEKSILAKLGIGETTEPAKPAPTASVPEGMVLVDASVLSEVQANAAAGKTAADVLTQQERDKLIGDAIEGKVPGDKGNARIVASQRKTWEDRFKVNPEEVRTLLTASADKGGLAAVIPATAVETGRSGDGEADPAADAAIEAAIDARFFPELVNDERKAA